MLRDIIAKEIQDTIMSPRFVFTFLLCTILILLSVYTGINNYQAEQKEFSAAVALNRKNLESQQTYQQVAGLGVKINREPQVLSTVVSGVQEAVGRVATVNIAFDPSLSDSKYSSSPIFAVFGALDLSFIVKIVLSLFAILFTYDAIVGEKERGTLKLALSNRIPRDRLILGKAIGGFISLLIPLVIPMVLGMLILMIYPNVSFSGEDWARLALIFVLFLLYLSVFFTLGLFVSARTSRSSTSFLLLLFIWVTFVTIIPKAAVMVASRIKPIPSVHEITAQKDAYLQEIQKEAIEGRNAYFKEHPRPEDPDALKQWNKDIQKWAEGFQKELTTKIDNRNASIERDYQTKMRGQEKLAVNLSRISPASALMFSSMSLARTGINEYERFLRSIRTYKPIFTKWANQKLFSEGPEAQPKLDDMPQHEFIPEKLSDSILRMLPDLALMLFLIILFFVGAFVSFLKYDVR
ncbi:MAG: ABC transporter permease subunit [Candidatus Aminicenantes bacterium]|jgi:ABC-type transport system involved in multi-copper enzyme maturation permease subunit